MMPKSMKDKGYALLLFSIIVSLGICAGLAICWVIGMVVGFVGMVTVFCHDDGNHDNKTNNE